MYYGLSALFNAIYRQPNNARGDLISNSRVQMFGHDKEWPNDHSSRHNYASGYSKPNLRQPIHV